MGSLIDKTPGRFDIQTNNDDDIIYFNAYALVSLSCLYVSLIICNYSVIPSSNGQYNPCSFGCYGPVVDQHRMGNLLQDYVKDDERLAICLVE